LNFFFCIFNYITWEYCIFLFLIIIRLLRTLFSLENVVIDFFLLDGVRLNLTILTCWISLLIVFSRFKIFKQGEFFFEFRLLVVSLELILLITFFVRDLFSFYFFFWVFYSSNNYYYYRLRIPTWTFTGFYLFFFFILWWGLFLYFF